MVKIESYRCLQLGFVAIRQRMLPNIFILWRNSLNSALFSSIKQYPHIFPVGFL